MLLFFIKSDSASEIELVQFFAQRLNNFIPVERFFDGCCNLCECMDQTIGMGKLARLPFNQVYIALLYQVGNNAQYGCEENHSQQAGPVDQSTGRTKNRH